MCAACIEGRAACNVRLILSVRPIGVSEERSYRRIKAMSFDTKQIKMILSQIPPISVASVWHEDAVMTSASVCGVTHSICCLFYFLLGGFLFNNCCVRLLLIMIQVMSPFKTKVQMK